MCGVIRHHLGKGRCAPVASPAMALIGIEPDQGQRNVWPFHHQHRSVPAPLATPWPTLRGLDTASALPLDHAQGDVGSPAPSTQGRIAAPVDLLAGLGAFPLHRHRTRDQRGGRSITAYRKQICRTTISPCHAIRGDREDQPHRESSAAVPRTGGSSFELETPFALPNGGRYP